MTLREKWPTIVAIVNAIGEISKTEALDAIEHELADDLANEPRCECGRVLTVCSSCAIQRLTII